MNDELSGDLSQQGDGEVGGAQGQGALVSPQAKNPAEAGAVRREPQGGNEDVSDSQSSSKRSSSFAIKKPPSKKKAKVLFRKAKRRKGDEVISRQQYSNCFGVGVKVLTQETVQTVLNMNDPSSPETRNEVKAISEMCQYGGYEIPRHIYGKDGWDVTLPTKWMYSPMPISENQPMVVELGKRHDARFNKSITDDDNGSKGGVSHPMDVAIIANMAEKAGIGVNNRVDVTDVTNDPFEVDQEWQRLLISTAASVQVYSLGMHIAVKEENSLRHSVEKEIRRLGLGGKFQMPPRSKLFSELKDKIRAGSMMQMKMTLNFEHMPVLKVSAEHMKLEYDSEQEIDDQE